jgi:hypothetical protein
MKFIRYAVLFILLPFTAWANCAPFPALDGGTVSTNLSSALDGSSRCFFFNGLYDSTGANAFPAVAPLSDTTSNPTTFLHGSLLEGWDSTNSQWHRLPTDTTAPYALKVDPGTVTLGANSSVNLSQVTGTTTAVGSGAVNAGSQRVAQAIDTATVAGSAPGTAGTPSPNVFSMQGETGMTPVLVSGGCAGASIANTHVAPINNAGAATNLLLVSKVAAQNIYICAADITAGAAMSVALVEGTQTTNACDTATAGMAGGATAATGWPLQSGPGGGLTKGSGQGIIYKTATVNHDVCLFFSSATQVSGAITWAQF